MTRETKLASAFVELAAALISGTQLDEFLHLLSCDIVALLDVDAVGVMVADENDRLRAIAASDENAHLLEIFALQHEEGVCLDVYRSGRPEQTSTATTADRWPHFSRLCLAHGYAWVGGIPLRHDAEILGAVNLFRRKEEAVEEDELRLGQALADVATAALLQRRETTQARRQAAQLQVALDSRVLIEQAKGVLSERLGLSPEDAFRQLRHEARDRNRRLHDLAREVVGGADVVPGKSPA